MIFKNNIYSGDKAHVLFCTQKDIDTEFVEWKLNPQGYFKHFYCNEIEVSLVKPKDIRTHICGCEYESIWFIGDGFRGQDIMFCLSRLKPKIKMRKQPIKFIIKED